MEAAYLQSTQNILKNKSDKQQTRKKWKENPGTKGIESCENDGASVDKQEGKKTT